QKELIVRRAKTSGLAKERVVVEQIGGLLEFTHAIKDGATQTEVFRVITDLVQTTIDNRQECRIVDQGILPESADTCQRQANHCQVRVALVSKKLAAEGAVSVWAAGGKAVDRFLCGCIDFGFDHFRKSQSKGQNMSAELLSLNLSSLLDPCLHQCNDRG